MVVTGSASPAGALGAVNLQADKNGSWVTVAHVLSKGGAFTLTYVAPSLPTDLVLRVSRGASKTHAAGVSKTLHVHVVNKHFTVTAVPGNTLLGPGQVLRRQRQGHPPGCGTVYLQRRGPNGSWASVAKTTLKKGSYYTLATTVQDGTLQYRVLRPYTASVAQGVSKTLRLMVNGPEVTTTGLQAVAGQDYLGSLTADSGKAPYEFEVSALPPGVFLLSSGGFFGRPTTVGTTTVTVTVADANQHVGTKTVQFVVSPVTVNGWGADVEGELGTGAAAPASRRPRRPWCRAISARSAAATASPLPCSPTDTCGRGATTPTASSATGRSARPLPPLRRPA